MPWVTHVWCTHMAEATRMQCTICLGDESDVVQRGCCCRGDAGAVHLQCLIDLATHAADNGGDWGEWSECGICKQNFTGCVRLGLAEAWVSRVQPLDDDDEERLVAASNYGSALRDGGKYTEAEKIELDVLATMKRVLGQEHPDTLDAANSLANTCRYQGKCTEAEKIQLDVFMTRKRLLGEEHPETLETAANLATTYSDQGKYSDAEKIEFEVLMLRKHVACAWRRAPRHALLGQQLGGNLQCSGQVLRG